MHWSQSIGHPPQVPLPLPIATFAQVPPFNCIVSVSQGVDFQLRCPSDARTATSFNRALLGGQLPPEDPYTLHLLRHSAWHAAHQISVPLIITSRVADLSSLPCQCDSAYKLTVLMSPFEWSASSRPSLSPPTFTADSVMKSLRLAGCSEMSASPRIPRRR